MAGDGIGEIVLSDDERTECEVWCRCMGYHRPVSEFNIGKKQEFRDRIVFRTEGVIGDDDRDP